MLVGKYLFSLSEFRFFKPTLELQFLGKVYIVLVFIDRRFWELSSSLAGKISCAKDDTHSKCFIQRSSPLTKLGGLSANSSKVSKAKTAAKGMTECLAKAPQHLCHQQKEAKGNGHDQGKAPGMAPASLPPFCRVQPTVAARGPPLAGWEVLRGRVAKPHFFADLDPAPQKIYQNDNILF